MDVVCLFHEDCFDGLGAAWAVFKRYPDGQYLPVDYKNPPPEGLAGKHVVIVDFSYDLPVMREILRVASHVTFLDHHERSESICAGLVAEGHANLTAVYNASQSGATMAWKHFHPGWRCPRILEYIADRDLWQFKYPETEEIMQGMGMYPLELTAWDEVLSPVDHNDPQQEDEFLQRLRIAGSILNVKKRTDVNRIIRQTLRYVTFLGFENIPMINVPRSLGSEALDQLTNDHDFALGYYDDPTHRVFSIRSKEGKGPVVNNLAQKFGGGGHPYAAGFRVPRDHYAARM